MALTFREILSQNIWDSFVLKYSPMALFQGWMWGDVVKAGNHALWRFGWFEDDTLVAVAQVQKVLARRGTFLHVRHGPVVRNKKYFKQIIAYLQTLAKTEHAWFLRVSPLLDMTPENTRLYTDLGLKSAPIHAMDAELCWVLDLDKSEDELLGGMRKTTRYEIKHAQKLGVTVQKSTDIKQFLDLYDKTSSRHNFVQHRGIREEIELLDTYLLLASFEGKTMAAAIIVYFGEQAIYHHGASILNNVGASYLLQWEAIREAKNRGEKLYNFWGIAPDDNPDHPWRGITLFKTGFGGRRMEFMHAADYPVSPLYIIPKMIETIRKRMKGY